MKPDIKEEWTRALRSGKYRQGQGVLRRNDTYCCLGVLCELAAEQGVVERVDAADVERVEVCEEEERPTHAYAGPDGNDAQAFYLPEAVQQWSGLPFNPVINNEDEGMRYLSTLNDQGRSFSHIADLIDQHL